MSDSRASLSELPAELFDDVCSHLSKYTLTLLARVSKSINVKVQNPLYYHATVRGFNKLSFLARTLGDCSKRDNRGSLYSKNICDLRLILDPRQEAGNLQTAVVLSRMIASIARFCPQIRMHLILENATCSGQPIRSFGTETFPRVTSLLLHTGPGEPQQPTQQANRALILNRRALGRGLHELLGGTRDHRCVPTQEFWTGIFNGTSFPQLEEVEIHHVQTARAGWGAPEIPASELKGLMNITRLAVDSAPELNSTVLMSALQCAPKLKHLELKNIADLDYTVLAKLINFALPNLSSFTLHVDPRHNAAGQERSKLYEIDPLEKADPFTSPIHLCPIIRECAKNIPKLDLFLPYICRELFLTLPERQKLSEAGVKRQVAGRLGEKLEGETGFDARSTSVIVGEYRKTLEQRMDQAKAEARVKEGTQKSLHMAEYAEQQERIARKRLIQQGQWTRTIRAGRRLCRSYESWEELGVLAGLGEGGVTWVLGHERLNLAGTYTPGQIAIEKSYNEMFPADTESSQADGVTPIRRMDGYDHNDFQ